MTTRTAVTTILAGLLLTLPAVPGLARAAVVVGADGKPVKIEPGQPLPPGSAPNFPPPTPGEPPDSDWAPTARIDASPDSAMLQPKPSSFPRLDAVT